MLFLQAKGKAGVNVGDDDEAFDGREDEDEAALNKKSVLLKGSVEWLAMSNRLNGRPPARPAAANPPSVGPSTEGPSLRGLAGAGGPDGFAGLVRAASDQHLEDAQPDGELTAPLYLFNMLCWACT